MDDPRVLDDPIALRIIRPEVAALLRVRPHEIESSPIASYLRAFLTVRSRFAEDELKVAVEHGVSQYVILGAGFDTFAYRNPFPALRIFEVDHPATQAAKQKRLGEASISLPATLSFVAVDFAVTSLAEGLRNAGLDESVPTFFSWLGVVPYLEREGIEATLQFVASLPRGTTIVFDFAIPPSSLSWTGRFVFRRMATRVAAVGEPWKTFFAPEELLDLLRALGFTSARTLRPAELNARYLAGRSDRLRIGEMGHIAEGVV